MNMNERLTIKFVNFCNVRVDCTSFISFFHTFQKHTWSYVMRTKIKDLKRKTDKMWLSKTLQHPLGARQSGPLWAIMTVNLKNNKNSIPSLIKSMQLKKKQNWKDDLNSNQLPQEAIEENSMPSILAFPKSSFPRNKKPTPTTTTTAVTTTITTTTTTTL